MIGLSHRRFDPEAFGCDWYESLQAAKAYSFDDRLEASVRHALRVERHVLWGAAHRSHLLHHPGIDAVAMRAGLEHDKGEDGRFAWLQLHHAGEDRKSV